MIYPKDGPLDWQPSIMEVPDSALPDHKRRLDGCSDQDLD